jgi:hypothetical protein
MKGNLKYAHIVFTCIILCLFVAGLSWGQENKSLYQNGGMGYFMTGVGINDIGNLNSVLKDHAYWDMSDMFYSIGGGGHAIIKRFIIGGEGHTIIGDAVTSGDTKTSLLGGYGLANVGYLVFSTKKLRLYPLVGFGGGGLTFKIVDTQGSPSFQELLDHPTRSVEMSTGCLLVSMSLGFDYLIAQEETEMGVGGMILGFRAGYNFALSKGEWEFDGVAVSNGPEIGFTGPYFRLIIGGGGVGKHK